MVVAVLGVDLRRRPGKGDADAVGLHRERRPGARHLQDGGRRRIADQQIDGVQGNGIERSRGRHPEALVAGASEVLHRRHEARGDDP